MILFKIRFFPGVDVLEFYAADKIDESWTGGKVLRAERYFAFDGA